MDPEQEAAILEQAQAALDDGGDAAEIDAIINANTQHPTFFGLRMAVESRADARQAEVLQSVSERGRPEGMDNRLGDILSGITNTGIMAGQGAALGGLDDLIGLFGGDKEAFQQAVAENREAEPLASAVSEIGGGLLVPGGIAKRLVGAGGAPRAAVVGAGVGAALGGTQGFLESTEEDLFERVRDAGPGALFGAAVGGVTGGMAGFVGPRMARAAAKRRGRVVAEGAEQLSRPNVTRHINTIRSQQDDLITIAAGKLDDLDTRHEEIVSGALTDFLDNIKGTDAGKALAQTSTELVTDQRFPNLKDMRRLLTNLRNGQFFGPRDELLAILKREIPEFEGLNAEFFKQNSILEALEIGQRGSGKTFGGVRIQTNTGANIDRALRELIPESHDAFLSGIMHRNMTKLLRDEAGVSLGALNTVIDNVDVEKTLRAVFPSDRAAEEFISLVRQQASATRLRQNLARAGVTAAKFAAIGAGVGAAASLF